MDVSKNNKQTQILIAISVVIIFLGLCVLLWAMWHGYAIGGFGIGHTVANLFVIPAGLWTGFPLGACGPDTVPMTYTNTVPQTYNESFLYRFGEPEPAAASVIPQMIDYPLRKDAIDTLMARAQVGGSEESIIGLYEFPAFRVLLVKTGENTTEVLAENDSIRMHTLVPLTVGSLHTGAAVPGPAQNGAYTMASASDVVIRRIDPVLPGPDNETFPLYIVQKDQEDTYRDSNGTVIAAITTNGTFYVLYGKRVECVVTGSSAVPGPGWTLCSENTAIEGSGSAVASLKHTVRLANGSERMLFANLIRTGASIQVSEGNMGSGSMWTSRDGSGCSC